MPISGGTVVTMTEESASRVDDLFRIVVPEFALRFEPIVKVAAVFAPPFLVSLIRASRDRVKGNGRVFRRRAVHSLGSVPKALDG
jgi:hypothetical protein